MHLVIRLIDDAHVPMILICKGLLVSMELGYYVIEPVGYHKSKLPNIADDAFKPTQL